LRPIQLCNSFHYKHHHYTTLYPDHDDISSTNTEIDFSGFFYYLSKAQRVLWSMLMLCYVRRDIHIVKITILHNFSFCHDTLDKNNGFIVFPRNFFPMTNESSELLIFQHDGYRLPFHLYGKNCLSCNPI
jgi:hypothetical protein